MAQKRLDPSSREDFIVEQFATAKKLNTIAGKLFDLIYIDVDRNSELSPMMRTMVPAYYVDPNNPEHPSQYIIAGKSSLDYVERLMFVRPYLSEKGKYEMDISAWKGLLITPAEFTAKTKGFRKTKLEPYVVMGERNGDRFCQSLLLRESDTRPSDELSIPFLELPNRKKYGEDFYQETLHRLIYDEFYRYLPKYIYRGLRFTSIPEREVQILCEKGEADFYTDEGDLAIVTKGIFPTATMDHTFSIAKVPDPDIDTSEGRGHYVILEECYDKDRNVICSIYTLVAAFQYQHVNSRNKI